jgi:transposase
MQWISTLREAYWPGSIAVCLEVSRGGLVASLLQHEELVLFPINPKQLSRFRDAMHPSGCKNDPGGARLLAEFVRDRHSQLREWRTDDATTRAIGLCCESRRKLVNEKKRVLQRLQGLLKSYFPLALELLGDSLGSRLGQDFLIRWASLASLRRAQPNHLLKFFREHNCRNSAKNERRIELIRTAKSLTTDMAIIGPSAMMAAALARQLRQFDQSIHEFDEEIERLMASHERADVFRSLPGAGAVLAPRLLAALGGDLERYGDAAEVQSTAESLLSRSKAAAARWFSVDVHAPNSSDRRFTSSPITRECSVNGPVPTIECSASAVSATMPPCAH